MPERGIAHIQHNRPVRSCPSNQAIDTGPASHHNVSESQLLQYSQAGRLKHEARTDWPGRFEPLEQRHAVPIPLQ